MQAILRHIPKKDGQNVKETLQHTMRSKVRVFEDGGIRLLRKGQKGLIHAIFSRFGLVLVLLVLQFGGALQPDALVQ